MPSIRHMDSSLDTVAKKAAAETALQLINDFCNVTSYRGMKKLEGAFVESVRAYVEYTLMGESRHAAEHLQEAHSWIERAKELARNGSTHSTAPPR